MLKSLMTLFSCFLLIITFSTIAISLGGNTHQPSYQLNLTLGYNEDSLGFRQGFHTSFGAALLSHPFLNLRLDLGLSENHHSDHAGIQYWLDLDYFPVDRFSVKGLLLSNFHYFEGLSFSESAFAVTGFFEIGFFAFEGGIALRSLHEDLALFAMDAGQLQVTVLFDLRFTFQIFKNKSFSYNIGFSVGDFDDMALLSSNNIRMKLSNTIDWLGYGKLNLELGVHNTNMLDVTNYISLYFVNLSYSFDGGITYD